MNEEYVPFCVSEYESGDSICDGDPNAKTDYDVKQCSWRDRCVAFREYLKRTGDQFEKHVKLVIDGESYLGKPKRGRNAFIKWCNSLVKKYKIEDGIINKAGVERKNKALVKKATRGSIKRAREKARVRKKCLYEMLEHFKMHFIENLEGYKFTSPRGIVRPGNLYIIDRIKTSKYLSLYCKIPGVLGVPVALIRFKPRTITFDIELPVDIEDFSGIGAEIMKKIHPKPIEDGRFKSICVGMDRERVAIVAKTIAKMIKRGNIQLPHPR